MAWLNDWANRLEIAIDSDRVDENLTDFPVLISLGSSVASNNFDATDIFDNLATESGIDSYTSFMMPTDGDRSSSQHDNIAFAYDPIITTIAGKSCVSLNGSNQCILVVEANHSDWSLGVDDFTLEAYVNGDDFDNVYRLISHGNLSTNGEWSWGIGTAVSWGSGYRMGFSWREGGADHRISSDELTLDLTPGSWYHVAVARSSGVLYFFLDGTLSGTDTLNVDLTAAGTTGDSEYLMLGARASSTTRIEFLPGYMTRCAIHKGIARWTSDFTPQEYPTNDSYTKFLYNFGGDQSQYKHDLQMVSDPEIHISNSATNGKGYWYFDGGGSPAHDQITVPHHSSLAMGGSDFTIEFYFKTINVSSNRYLLTKRTGIPYANVNIIHMTTGYVNTSISNAAGDGWQLNFTDGFGYAPTGEWVYYALTRAGSTGRIYINGVIIYEFTFSGDIYDDGGPLNIGGRGDGTYGYYGYIQGLKITKGTAKYTGYNFTPPDLPDGDSWVNRKKIAVTDSNNNMLYTEIERWDHTNQQAWLWTKVPNVSSSTDTTLYLYYDKTQSDNTDYVGDTRSTASAQVWSDNFNAVWHMNIHTYGASWSPMLDSTINGNDLGTGGFNWTGIFQMVDGYNTPAINFDSINNYFTIVDNSTLDLTTNYTIEALFKPTSDDQVNEIICKANNDSNGYQFRGDYGVGPNFRVGNGYGVTGRASWQVYNWQYAAGVCTTTSGYLYLDGSYYDEGAFIGTPNNSSNFYIGRRWDSYYFDGQISEIRLSSTPRPASYVKANYYNMFDNLLTLQQGQYPFFTCSGIVTVNTIPTENIPIRLYRRNNGELVSLTTTVSGGLFTIDSPYDEEHYIIALYTASGTNALIYDRIQP